MKNTLINRDLHIKKSPIHGWGVFAERDYAKDEIVEECYTLLTDGKDEILCNYYFSANEKCGVLTGFGLLYNHSTQPNLTYFFEEKYQITVFQAMRSIKKGEELLIDYGDLWMESRNMKVKRTPLSYKIMRYFLGKPLRLGVVLGGLFILSNLLASI